MRFRIEVRGQLIEADLTHADTTYTLLEGAGIAIQHFGEQLRLAPGEPACRATVGDATKSDGEQLPLAA